MVGERSCTPACSISAFVFVLYVFSSCDEMTDKHLHRDHDIWLSPIACVYAACVRAWNRLSNLLVPPVGIAVEEQQTKRPWQLHPVRDRSELLGVPRKQILMASSGGHGVESVYFFLSRR